MSNQESFRRLDKLFRRLSITKGEMPDYYTVDAAIYHGMGDFTSFQAHGSTLSEATENVLMKYCENYGIGRAELERWFNENP